MPGERGHEVPLAKPRSVVENARTMKMAFRIFARLTAAGALLALISCGHKQVFQVKGVVEEVRAADRKLKIAHEKIPGYMDAMTMTFDVKGPGELTALQRGDTISFRMVVTDKDGWIEQIQKLAGAAPVVAAAPDNFRRAREVDPLNLGDPLPDYHFTNELGRAVSLGDFKGGPGLHLHLHALPVPDFLPAHVGQPG